MIDTNSCANLAPMENDMTEKTYVSWGGLEMLCSVLHDNILSSDFRPTFIVGISRGGLVPGVILSHRLNVPFEPLSYSTRDFLSSDDSKLADICAGIKDGAKVLIVDDICDSGRTFLDISAYFEEAGLDKTNIRWATLHLRTSAEFTPNYFAELISNNNWIVYPYEDRS